MAKAPMARKRCLFCRKYFEVYLPMAARQRVCKSAECRRKLKRLLDRAWRRSDPEWCKALLVRRRGPRRTYMRKYRVGRPAYRAREAARMWRRRARAWWAPHVGGQAVVTQEL